MGADELKSLLALAERVLNLYYASDVLHYGIFPAELTISHEYVARVGYSDEVQRREREFGVDQARQQLGQVGRMDDAPSLPGPIEAQLESLEQATQQDLGFGLRDVISVLHLLSLWAANTDEPESACYQARRDTIAAACVAHLSGFDEDKARCILDFLTLKSSDVMHVAGEPAPQEDIPVWEYAKRKARYTVKPLIIVGDMYCWGPYSAHRAGRLWSEIATSHKLPLPLDLPATQQVLERAHHAFTQALQHKIAEVVGRFTDHVESEVFLHKVDRAIEDIGDCDVLAYLPAMNTVLNIESKIIDAPRCVKDSRRLAEKIFGRLQENGASDRGYLGKVERRHRYLAENAGKVLQRYGWASGDAQPRVVSIFVTQRSYWWTKYPPVDTDVQFVECVMLFEFLSTLKPT